MDFDCVNYIKLKTFKELDKSSSHKYNINKLLNIGTLSVGTNL